MPTAAPRLVLLITAAIAAAIVATTIAITVSGDSALPLGVVAGLVAGSAVLVTLDRRSPSMALQKLRAQPLEQGREQRLESLVTSLCASHGIAEPKLHVVESQAIDAAVVGRLNDNHLVLTTGALRALDRLELEAVVARQLTQLNEGVHAATNLVVLLTLLGPLAGAFRGAQRSLGRAALLDVCAVQMTRYPPALASAFEKAARSEHAVAPHLAVQHLWMIGPPRSDVRAQPQPQPQPQPHIQERIDTIREL